MASNKDIWDDFSSDDEAAAEKIKTEKLLLKKFKSKVKNTMDEKELLELIREKKYNESEIDTEIKNKLKYIEAKGDEYGWQEVVKGKKLKKIELEAEEPNEEMEEEEYNTYDDRYSKKYYRGDKRYYSTNYYGYRGQGGYYRGYRGRGGYKPKKYEKHWNKGGFYKDAYSSFNLSEDTIYKQSLTERPNYTENNNEELPEITKEEPIKEENEEVKEEEVKEEIEKPKEEEVKEEIEKPKENKNAFIPPPLTETPKEEIEKIKSPLNEKKIKYKEQNLNEDNNEEIQIINEGKKQTDRRARQLKWGFDKIKKFRKERPKIKTEEIEKEADKKKKETQIQSLTPINLNKKETQKEIILSEENQVSFSYKACYENPYRSYFMQCEKESRYPFLIPAMPMQVPQNQMQGKMCPYMVPMPYMNYPMNMMSQNQQGVNPNQSQTDNNFYKSNNPYVHKP